MTTQKLKINHMWKAKGKCVETKLKDIKIELEILFFCSSKFENYD